METTGTGFRLFLDAPTLTYRASCSRQNAIASSR